MSSQRYCTASSSGRQPIFAALNRGCHLCSAGRPSRWALAHILVCICVSCVSNKTDGGDIFWSLPFRQSPTYCSVQRQYTGVVAKCSGSRRQRCADPEMLRPHHSADSDHRSANWGHSELGAQSGRKNQPVCLCVCLSVTGTSTLHR